MIINLELKEEIVPPEDHHTFTLYYTGGLTTRRLTKGWALEPVPISGKPHIIGAFSDQQIKSVIENLNVKPICYEQQGFSSGVGHRFFRPWSSWTLTREQSAGDLWSSIAGNIDAKVEREKELARHIALGIRSVEVHMGRISSFYGMQLFGAIASGKTVGHRFSMGADLEISASVHDFYASVGSLRDYLAALIAARNGLSKKVNDFTKLMKEFKEGRIPSDTLMGVLFTGNHLTQVQEAWVAAGILNEIRLFRRRMVHGKPYGSFDDELWGQVVEAHGGQNLPVLLYEQCLVGDDGKKHELLTVVRRHYLFMMKLLEDMAHASGYSSELPVFDESNASFINFSRR